MSASLEHIKYLLKYYQCYPETSKVVIDYITLLEQTLCLYQGAKNIDIPKELLGPTGEYSLPNGYRLFWESNGVGGRNYYSNEIGGNPLVWDTTICYRSTLETAMQIEDLICANQKHTENT